MPLTGQAKTEAQRRRREQRRAERASGGRQKGVRNPEVGVRYPEDLLPETVEEAKSQLSPREIRLAMLYAEGGHTLSDCCRIVGITPESHTIKKRLRSGDIGMVVSARMRELGLTIDAPLLKIRDMFDARKEVVTKTDVVEVRDNESQRWAAEQALKLHNAYPKPQTEQPDALTPPTVTVSHQEVTLQDGRTATRMSVVIGAQ